jgi:hypothetical protein
VPESVKRSAFNSQVIQRVLELDRAFVLAAATGMTLYFRYSC